MKYLNNLGIDHSIEQIIPKCAIERGNSFRSRRQEYRNREALAGTGTDKEGVRKESVQFEEDVLAKQKKADTILQQLDISVDDQK